MKSTRFFFVLFAVLITIGIQMLRYSLRHPVVKEDELPADPAIEKFATIEAGESPADLGGQIKSIGDTYAGVVDGYKEITQQREAESRNREEFLGRALGQLMDRYGLEELCVLPPIPWTETFTEVEGVGRVYDMDPNARMMIVTNADFAGAMPNFQCGSVMLSRNGGVSGSPGILGGPVSLWLEVPLSAVDFPLGGKTR